MSLGFMGGAYNRATGTRNAFGALSDDLQREGHPRMVSKSGDREPQDEIDVFLSRYRPQATGNGAYGDVKWWNGVRYVRFSSAGPVAVPGNSNHGRRRSNDLAYPYNDTNTAAHKRARVLAQRHNITCEGLNFREPWHWTFWGALGTIDSPALAGGTEDDMGTLDNTEETYQTIGRIFQRAIKFDIRENGFGPDWRLGPTLWEKIAGADDSADIAKIGASVGAEIAKLNVTLAGLATPDLNIDVDKLTTELRAGLAPEIAKALGEKLAA